ncbi:BAH and coiled-coil domain-containing protein 1 [Araneus ventricosus]|uniref:BAH and coiled-coil domain-containing protein 1 n=1 Tax=Araneus ventricosus TaxID=182803 RepID=A0A4Y2I9F6_ARAVE|nr:BAH and coiled-coil domain-containing protein 1 [Araneus ventricosus]
METRHDLSVDHARLLSTGGGYAAMDNSATGHPNSQQLRPPYGDLCRPPGTDASTLSAAYHSRYLASMPLTTGSTFPFLGGMFTGTLPGPPTSPFRAPSTPGVNNMRFWPPTPPPEGYGRYSMNTSLFPLFGAPSPDSGAFLSQGLVSRLGSTAHLSPVIDHKEHSFFTHGIGLGSPLTPTSHVTSPSPFPHLIPSLERHPFIGHMTLGNKELEDLQHEADDVRLMKSHMDCLIKHDIPSSRQDRLKSKSDAKLCCEKAADDCCKLSSPCIPRDGGKTHDNMRNISKLEGKNQNHHPTNKVQPCKIEVSHSPTLKHDLLSPPIESPRLDLTSPCKNLKKNATSPISSPSAMTNHVNNSETRCSQCAASMKGVAVATKLNTNGALTTVASTTGSECYMSKNCPTTAVTALSMTNSESISSNITLQHSRVTSEHSDNSKHTNQKSPRTSPVITLSDKDKTESLPCKSKNIPEPVPEKLPNSIAPTIKHVTAAVIPTAPKQAVLREGPTEICYPPAPENSKEIINPELSVCSEINFSSENHSVKLELSDSSNLSEKPVAIPMCHASISPVCNSLPQKPLIKSPSTSCKVKDMIRNVNSSKQFNGEKLTEISPSKGSDVENYSKSLLPNSPTMTVPSSVSNCVSPTNLVKNPCQTGKMPPISVGSASPIMKAEMVNTRLDCEFSQKSGSWTKATVLPFNWQNNSMHDEQAINLTVSKKPVKPEPNEPLSSAQNQDVEQSLVKATTENTIATNGIVGVCHPNPSPVAVNKVKGTPAVSSISNFSSISVVNQPTEQATEVHILHRSSKSSFPVVNRNATPPVPLKSTISHVTSNTSIHRSIKAERLTNKRGKLGDVDKLNYSGRATLATLAPKLSKTVGFGKDAQASHTLSTSSSVSSTSIVFPATVNPCIPVGIAIAQQRQDSSTATTGKSQPSVPSSTPSVVTPNQHLASSRVAADLQAQELIADQKNQDLSCSNNPTPVDANLLVTQGPTIVSRQWESEALTRTAMPSASWLTHGSVVAPAVWLGQGAYAAAPTSNSVPSIAMNPLDPSPISLPPGGYQLARDSISGHLLLIPTANIELMDRPSVWPSFNTSAGNLPIQQLVTQQQHTQFEQVLPHTETQKTEGMDSCNIASCDLSAQPKTDDKVEDMSGQVPSVPLATGQTYAFTTFPTQCDPSSFSYVLQSSTVMHLAHTQTASSIQTDSGRRSQGTSPLHCATPSPPPNTCSVQVSITEDEESDNDSEGVACGESTEVQLSCHNQSVTTAIQVDMDSQTNSEEDEEEEPKAVTDKPEETKVEMSDSANQTESVPSESPKSDPDPDPEPETEDVVLHEQLENQEPSFPSDTSQEKPEIIPSISIKEDIVNSEPGMEIVTSETELAPLLPVESKPVMDFIDHHGLNLLVDSIEEFASREQQDGSLKIGDSTLQCNIAAETTSLSIVQDTVVEEQISDLPKVNETNLISEKTYSSKYKTLDTTCTDGLGLLCALAEQRFLEESMNVDDNKTNTVQTESQDSYSFSEETKTKIDSNSSLSREQTNSDDSFLSSCSSSQDYEEVSELDMRARLAELQKKYRQKQRELELLRNKREKENSDDEFEYVSNSPKPPKSLPQNKSSSVPQSKLSSTFQEHSSSKNTSSKFSKKKQKKVQEESAVESNFKSAKKTKVSVNKNNVQEPSREEEHAKVPSITLVHESNANISNDSNTSSGFSSSSLSKKTCNNQDYNNESSSASSVSKDDNSSQDQDYDKNDKTKTPIFDEQAWFVRRSERIFLSDARSVATTTPDKSTKKNSSSCQKVHSEVSHKEKKETVKSIKISKASDESENKKVKGKTHRKPKLKLSKKYLSDCDSDSSSNEMSASDSEHSDGASSTSENLPLSTFVEQSTQKAVSERQKRLSVDSACSDISSGQSEDIPLSVLIGQKNETCPELKSCILKPNELQKDARLLVLDEGLFYAGHVTKSDDSDVYGILIDGDRAARPHMFSKEEILNAAVLEVKPTHKQQLPEGSRICAFWSQQYRCLYPGTVTKSSSPMPDPSMLYVEFDDGDSGRIPLNDIRMLPPDFPIVSMEPNPFMILGKRRSRAQSQNSCGTNDGKNGNESSNQMSEKDKSDSKKQRNSDKSIKKSYPEGKSKESLKRKRSPSASNRSRSSSKSSSTSRAEAKNQNLTISEDHKKIKSEEKTKTISSKSKDSDCKTENSSVEPKPKKHKKHKDKEDHHKHHHHHHHKHHHHKKHKAEKHERRTSNDTVISSSTSSTGDDSPACLSSSSVRLPNPEQDMFILENSKTDLTFKIKKSPSPHTNPEDAAAAAEKKEKRAAVVESSDSSSSDEDVVEPAKKKTKKSKGNQNKPAKRKERVPSVEKSKIAAFLPVRQLWRWSGKSFRRPGAKGKAKKEFYRAIQRGKETIRVGDCAVFLSTGRPHLPYIGRIETMWESWGGKMDVKVKWFYHPEETKSGKKLSHLKGALFQSPHFDENDVQTISHKCEVLSWGEYQEKKHPENKYSDDNDTYFLAGTYDPILGTLILEPGVPGIPSTQDQ